MAVGDKLPDPLPVGGAAALLLGYGMVFATAGALITIRRDGT